MWFEMFDWFKSVCLELTLFCFMILGRAPCDWQGACFFWGGNENVEAQHCAAPPRGK